MPETEEAAVALIAEFDGTAYPYALDVSDEAAVRAHADQVAALHGVPDVLVNNAGAAQAAPFPRTPGESFKRVLDINLFGVVHDSRAFGTLMAERGLAQTIIYFAAATTENGCRNRHSGQLSIKSHARYAYPWRSAA
ncbi:SDR family oxidoreductase [Nocardia sp. NBC_01503]|uniref:SDR family oxidoreductase n=1 Tax=Nocardia sp. NBC_01503 TaxID=2975997 RepID=UPI003FA5F72E